MILTYLRDNRSREIHKLKRNICPRPYSYTPTLVGLVLKTSRLTLVTLYTLGNLRISPHTSISVMHITNNLLILLLLPSSFYRGRGSRSSHQMLIPFAIGSGGVNTELQARLKKRTVRQALSLDYDALCHLRIYALCLLS